MPTAVASLGARLAASIAQLFDRAPLSPRDRGEGRAGGVQRSHREGHQQMPMTPEITKASAAGPLIAFEHLRRPVWTPRDYAAFANEGFMQNAIVYRCVRMIAECAAHVPLLLYRGDHEIEEHPLLDLLRRPNGHEAWPDFMQRLVGFLLVSGNAYVEGVAIDSPGAGRHLEGQQSVRELFVLRPDRIKLVPGADGWPEAFDYTAGGRTVRIAGDAVDGVRAILHVKLFHPTNDHYGLSPLEAAASAIDLHNTASRWNKALLDNSARPSGAIVYTARDGNLTGEQVERLKAELEAGFQGSANAGRPLLLEGGLDWKAMSLSPKDMDFIEARHVAAREIALALGVPPMLLGIPGDNTYANLAEAQRTFWRQTVLPLVERIASALSMWLSPGYAPDAQWASEGATKNTPDATLVLRPDLDNLPALAAEREALWASLEKTSFLTTDEKRALAGFTPAGEHLAAKLNPYHDAVGRFTTADGAGDNDRPGELQLISDTGRSVDLLDEESRGGHTIKKHVGKSEAFLINRVRTEVYRVGMFTVGLEAAGTFTSLEAANKVVSSTLAENQEIVARVASGHLDRARMDKQFGSPTGIEAYRKSDRSEPCIRDTNVVRVIIEHDRSDPRGFRIMTAFPMRRN